MAMLEEEVTNLRLQADAFTMERRDWEQQMIQSQDQIRALMYEKEDMVVEHTRETGELRKKVNVLTEKLNARASAPATVTPNSTDFADFATEMNGLTMDQDEWNNYIFVDNMFQDQDGAPQHPPQSNALVVASRPKQQQPIIADAEKPAAASGLLLMLLLCGAFFASKSSGTQALPKLHMPDEVRAEAANVLDNILKEGSHSAGNAHATAHHMIASQVNAMEPGPSGVATAAWQPKATLSGAEFASISNPSGLGIDDSTLGQMHHNLVMPTKEQEAEQLFGLTPNQYNSLTTTEFNRPAYNMQDSPPATDEASTSPTSGRKTLAQALQNRHDEAWTNGKAAVYTRSLLGEQIPADIVREFQRIVQQSGDAGEQNVKSEA
ncbi:hypothetical protein NA57DRAFT_42213 [Rhizodiscina lignyota]|uniref:Uncharacterized protein n=1 Tax=Rhizodiscina lignyota TaxID=1504668 RepID=A0A9P4M3P4_9PEZI|nr:hypothetical protein NA57DRAFT_42213 [Rhizodiscina lignyota]